MPGTILIGIVTHANSTFNKNGTPARQLDKLSDELTKLGIHVMVVISDRDEFTENGGELSLSQQLSSAYHQTQLESQWRRYIRGSNPTSMALAILDIFQCVGMFIKRCFHYAKRRSTLSRLMNIDLSHMRIMSEGISADADWILILEDDALAPSIEVASNAISAAVTRLDPSTPIFINLSESFSTSSLGVKQIASAAESVLSVNATSELVRMPKPITNTVCANLYSLVFVKSFRQSIEENGLLPSYPIDWRLNKFILDRSQQPVTCYWVQPGVFLQGSMH